MEKHDPLQPEDWPEPAEGDSRAADSGGVPLEPEGGGGGGDQGGAPGPDDSGEAWMDLEESDQPKPQGPRVERSGESAPIPLESETGRRPADEEYVHSLDVCSNCGAPMRGETMVCFRCGWNMRTGRVEMVKTGVVEVDEHGRDATDEDVEGAEEPERITPLSEPGRGDAIVPLIMAGVSVLLLLVGFLFGASGLFPQNDPPDSTLAMMLEFFATLVVLALGACCGVLALSFLGWLLKGRLGDLKLAAARMLGIVAVVMLAEFINLPSMFLERVVELALQAALFAGLSAYFFKLSMRDAATLTLSFIMAAIGLVAVTGMVRLVS